MLHGKQVHVGAERVDCSVGDVVGETVRGAAFGEREEACNLGDVDVLEEAFVLAQVRDAGVQRFGVAKEGVGRDADAALVEERDGLFGLERGDGVERGVGEPRGEVSKDGIGDFFLVGQRGARENEVLDYVLRPDVLNVLVQRMRPISIEGDGGFVPVCDELERVVEGEHVVHGAGVRLDVANDDFHLVANGVVDLEYRPGPFVFGELFGGEVVQTDVVRGVASKRKRNALVDGDGGAREREPDVPRDTDKDDFVLLRESERRKRFPGTGGRGVENEVGLRGRFLLERAKELFLVLKQVRVSVLPHVGVGLDANVRVLEDDLQQLLGTSEPRCRVGDDGGAKLHDKCVFVGDGKGVLDVSERVHVRGCGRGVVGSVAPKK